MVKPRKPVENVEVAQKPDETPEAATHRVVMAEGARHAVAGRRIAGQAFADALNVPAMTRELQRQSKQVAKGDLSAQEYMLLQQAQTLDLIFTRMVMQAEPNMGEYMSAAETYMRLALKAQAQARATIETLAEIKNPRPVAFVKQANIAHGHQQVNNGDAALPAPPQAQISPPAPDALAGTWTAAREALPATRARENPEASKAE